jgi:hypothetical protein
MTRASKDVCGLAPSSSHLLMLRLVGTPYISSEEWDGMLFILLHAIMIEEVIVKHDMFILLFLEIVITKSMCLM